MEKKFNLMPPMMPNFISYNIGPALLQDGFKNNTLPIESLSEEEALEYAELMKQSFINHWKRRTAKGNPNFTYDHKIHHGEMMQKPNK